MVRNLGVIDSSEYITSYLIGNLVPTGQPVTVVSLYQGTFVLVYDFLLYHTDQFVSFEQHSLYNHQDRNVVILTQELLEQLRSSDLSFEVLEEIDCWSPA